MSDLDDDEKELLEDDFIDAPLEEIVRFNLDPDNYRYLPEELRKPCGDKHEGPCIRGQCYGTMITDLS